MYKRLLFVIPFIVATACAPSKIAPKLPAPGTDRIEPDPVDHMFGQSQWADAALASLTPRERIAQLFMVAGYSNRAPAHADSLEKLVRDFGIGGVIWFQGGPVRQTRIANRLQEASKIPLFYAMDAEWGVGMRLDSTLSYPYQIALGALPSDSLVELMGRQIAADFRRLGMHINFAPVADVNNNAANPVISFRSFGEDRDNVASKAVAYAKGLQSGRILTSGKHFPGHGDTDTDSHLALPVIRHGRARLDSLELYPFRKMLENGLAGVMIAHLSIPALDNTPNLPSTLSGPIVDGLLRRELHFDGLVFTDAMNMKGVTDFFPTGEAEIRALLAGNDMLVFSTDVPKAILAIEAAVTEGRISQAYIDAKARKVLAAKQWAGLDQWSPVPLQGLGTEIAPASGERLFRAMAEQYVTVASNQGPLLPLKPGNRVAVLSIGYSEMSPFQKALGSGYDPFWLTWQTSEAMAGAVMEALKGYDEVVIAIHEMRRRPWNTINPPAWIGNLVAVQGALPGRALVVFANPYTWLEFEGAEAFDALVMAYDNNVNAQQAAADIMLGKKPAMGRLPVSLGPSLRQGAHAPVQ